jgi:hypothetical protein
MNIAKLVLASTAVVGTLAVFNPAARADEWNEKTEVTFSNPVEVPGNRVLQAGTYWLEVMDRDAIPMQDVVVIYDEEQTQVEATFLTKPVQSNTPSRHTELTLAEQGPNQPDALLTWYYPGKNIGHQFLYPTSHQRLLDDSNTVKLSVPVEGF